MKISMISILITILCAVLLGVFLPSCSNPSSGGGGSNPVVYVAGYYTGGSGKKVACYWKDGVKTDLTDGTNDAEAFAIFVVSGSVYVAGYDNNQAYYWKDNMAGAVPLPGALASRGNGIYVSGGTVYVAGYSDNLGQAKACYWVDSGTPTKKDLLGAQPSQALSVFLSGSDVNTSGYYSGSTASYWVNELDLPTPLPDGTGGRGMSIVVSGGTRYTAGYYDGGKACFWVEDAAPNHLDNSAKGLSISVSGGLVYTAGFYNPGAITATYWIGTTRQPDLTGTIPSRAEAIHVVDGVVYTAGWHTPLPSFAASYWTDGVRTDLTDGSSNAQAYSIYVVP